MGMGTSPNQDIIYFEDHIAWIGRLLVWLEFIDPIQFMLKNMSEHMY